MKSRWKNIFSTVKNLVGSAVGSVSNMLRQIAGQKGMSVSEKEIHSVDEFAEAVTDDIAKDIKKELEKEKGRISQSRKKLINQLKPMVRKANKRLDMLREKGLETVSAYGAWERNGAILFSVKGKTYQELQREYWRVKNFLDASTSTVSGAIKNMERIATDIMGLSNDVVSNMSVNRLISETTNFFKISEQIKADFEKLGNKAAAMEYMKIFNAIAEYTRSNDLDIALVDNNNILAMAEQIEDLITRENAIMEELMKW